MYKSSMPVCTVSKHVKIKFGIIIESDKPIKNSKNVISISKFNGNTYLNVTSYPFLTVDISGAEKGDWNTNKSYTLSNFSIYLFKKRMGIFLKNLAIKDMFFQIDGELKVNKEMAKKYTTVIPTGKGKTIMFIPSVVEDEEGNKLEGCQMLINDYNNFALMSWQELEYFIEFLKEVDMNQLALQMINTCMLEENRRNSAIVKTGLNTLFKMLKNELTSKVKSNVNNTTSYEEKYLHDTNTKDEKEESDSSK